MHQKHTLSVEKVRSEGLDWTSVFFQSPKDFIYRAGDCFTLTFPKEPELGGKVFSFASSPTEKDVFITYKKGISEFKKKLDNLSQKEIVDMIYYGSQFTLQPEKQSIFFAGGIGITPFRSMIKEVVDRKQKIAITLIYLYRGHVFPFRKEFMHWQDNIPLQTVFINTLVDGRLDKSKLLQLFPQIGTSTYEHYIAGPPGMIDATFDLLISTGVSHRQIHTDSFDGYNLEPDLVTI